MEPRALQLPEGALDDARTVVWLGPGAPPIVRSLDERLPLQIPSEDSELQALLYRCSPEELEAQRLLSEHGCLPPTERQLAMVNDQWTTTPPTDAPQIPTCSPCALWPIELRQSIRVPPPILAMEVGVALPDGQLLFTAFTPQGSEMVRFDVDQGRVERIPPLDGPSSLAFSPYFADDSGLYGMRDKALWRIALEAGGYRAERLTGRHPLESYDRASSLIRIGERYYLATAHGGLVRTSSTSTSGWIRVRPNWTSTPDEESAIRTSMVEGEGAGLAAVGVVWARDHYEPRENAPPVLFGFYDQRSPGDGWRILPLNQAVVSVVEDHGRVYVIGTAGNVYRLRADGELDLAYAPSRPRNFRYAVAGLGRIWAAPQAGSILPLYPDQGLDCDLIPSAFGGLILASKGRLVHVSNADLTVVAVPPIVECGLPTAPLDQ